MEAGIKSMMSNRVEKKRRGPFAIGLGLSGLVFVIGLTYNQMSFDTYTQANTRTMEWENRLSEFITVRGQFNGVVQSISGMDVNSALSSGLIEQKAWNLQTAWSEFRNQPQHDAALPAITVPSLAALDTGIDRIALAALKTAVGLRRSDPIEARRQAKSLLQINLDLSTALAGLEQQIIEVRQGAEGEKERAIAGMNRAQRIAFGAFYTLASVLVAGLVVLGFQGFRVCLSRRAETPLVDA